MNRKIFFILALCILTLSACGNSFHPTFQTTYRLIEQPRSEKITIEELKPYLESRLNRLDLRGHEVRLEGNQLIVDLDVEKYDIAKAVSLTYQYDLILQESRDTFTEEEKKALNNYNQAQRDIITKSHGEAVANPDNMDEIVFSTHERVNKLQKGIKGPASKAKVNDDQYWAALEQTDVGKITPLVETSTTLWFAKVLEKDANNSLIRYQEVVRLLKPANPRLDYIPIASFGKDIVNVEVIKKDQQSTKAKNYLVKVTLNEKGKEKLAQISKQYQGKPLRFFVDDTPDAKITFEKPITDGIILLDYDYNQQESNLTASQLSIGYMPALLTLTNFVMR